MKKTITILMVICMLFSLSACNNDSKAKIEDNQTIKLSETEITLPIGETTPLLIETTPEDIKDKITWKSSDENIAKYFGGEVLAKNKGTCEITATTPNGISATCKIIVSAKIIDSGPCGENVTWTYYDDYNLVISGTGDMAEYYQSIQLSDPLNDGKSMPWNRYTTLIKEIIIEEGVTSISRCAFLRCTFEKISIPSSVKRIGYKAFYFTRGAANIVIPKSVEEIGARVNGESNCILFYESTENDFNKILKPVVHPATQVELNGAGGKVFYYSEEQKENSWHYVDGVPTAW